MQTPLINLKVKTVFESYPDVVREKLLFLRELILDVAANTEGVGELEETLKWGEPSYLTSTSKSGSTIRITWSKKSPLKYGMYFNCKTSLLDTFRTLFPHDFQFDGNRAILFDIEEMISEDDLRDCIAIALTYHLQKKLL